MSKNISKKECVDTGMAFVLIALISYLVSHRIECVYAAVCLLLVNMTFSSLYSLPARLWMGLSALMGAVMSKVILLTLYYVILTPLALLLKSFGHDPMAERKWKNGTDSIFVSRRHVYHPEDLESPF